MEALLTLQPAAEAIADASGAASGIDAISGQAIAVLADLAVETALDTMIEGMTDAPGASDYLAAGAHLGGSDMGLLDHMIDSAMAGNHPMAIVDGGAEEAAAAAAAA